MTIALTTDLTAPLDSLARLDPVYPQPEAARLLSRPENEHLLRYVTNDAFGSHVFPGNLESTPAHFLADLDRELASGLPYFLWATIPICRYHCLYCQFPIVVQSRNDADAGAAARKWVDANLAEAEMWLEAVPHLASAPVGEFCFFGGTPTLLPEDELARILTFYRDRFHFTPETTLRIEGSPDSLTREKLALLRAHGCSKITYGIQTFDDRLLKLSNRLHTGEQAVAVRRHAGELGFARIDGDLIYGLLDQSVEAFERDLRRTIELDYDGVVVTKLHLRAYEETGTAIAGVDAPWQDPRYRARLVDKGHRWPSLGEQYQMRERAVEMLALSGRTEYPTMYFQSPETGCGTWKALVLDEDKQRAEVGIGLGGSSGTPRGAANVTVSPREYFESIGERHLPIVNATRLDREGEIAGSIRRALSTCQPLHEDAHRARFPESSLLGGKWRGVFDGLERRGLAQVDSARGAIRLTKTGNTLVEAIMHTEFV
jgi:oxygen-independent coproporphyrinogen-3 oxidase